jgi:hypothetical protein
VAARSLSTIPTSSPSQIRKNRGGGGVPPPAPPPRAPLRGALGYHPVALEQIPDRRESALLGPPDLDPSLIGRDWSPVSSNKARGYCRLPSNFVSTTEPNCSRCVQPGGICVCVSVVHREPTPGGPGSGWRRGRKRLICQLPLWSYLYIRLPEVRGRACDEAASASCASCRSDIIW